ncbi:MAG: 50S ribosomal protein L6 [Candidatus Moranbacteria bacterium]|nr:50S ribosomal protein L6 [Candidatus Moranbacteria bacterium]
MSRIGKEPIKIPDGVSITVEGNSIKAKGSKGELSLAVHPNLEVKFEDDKITILPQNKEDDEQRALWGTYRVLVNNIITGVSKGYTKELEVNGTGYRVSVSGRKLVLGVGFSHPVEIEPPEDITFTVEENKISVSGIDKQKVGEWASRVRAVRKVEPYKGKGIKYVDEYVKRKVGKKAVGESA